jgi:hypothetical protein
MSKLSLQTLINQSKPTSLSLWGRKIRNTGIERRKKKAIEKEVIIIPESFKFIEQSVPNTIQNKQKTNRHENSLPVLISLFNPLPFLLTPVCLSSIKKFNKKVR